MDLEASIGAGGSPVREDRNVTVPQRLDAVPDVTSAPLLGAVAPAADHPETDAAAGTAPVSPPLARISLLRSQSFPDMPAPPPQPPRQPPPPPPPFGMLGPLEPLPPLAVLTTTQSTRGGARGLVLVSSSPSSSPSSSDDSSSSPSPRQPLPSGNTEEGPDKERRKRRRIALASSEGNRHGDVVCAPLIPLMVPQTPLPVALPVAASSPSSPSAPPFCPFAAAVDARDPNALAAALAAFHSRRQQPGAAGAAAEAPGAFALVDSKEKGMSVRTLGSGMGMHAALIKASALGGGDEESDEAGGGGSGCGSGRPEAASGTGTGTGTAGAGTAGAEGVCALSLVELLLGAGASVEACDADGLGALHWAAATGCVPVVTALIRQGGADPDMKSLAPQRQTGSALGFSVAAGERPLHRAARLGRGGMVDALLKLGANPNRLNGSLELPLDVAGTDLLFVPLRQPGRLGRSSSASSSDKSAQRGDRPRRDRRAPPRQKRQAASAEATSSSAASAASAAASSASSPPLPGGGAQAHTGSASRGANDVQTAVRVGARTRRASQRNGGSPSPPPPPPSSSSSSSPAATAAAASSSSSPSSSSVSNSFKAIAAAAAAAAAAEDATGAQALDHGAGAAGAGDAQAAAAAAAAALEIDRARRIREVRLALLAHDPSRRLLVLHHPDCLAHITGPGHQEAPERVTAILQRILSAAPHRGGSGHRAPMAVTSGWRGLVADEDCIVRCDVPLASLADLTRVHAQEYVDCVVELDKTLRESGSQSVPFTPRVQSGVRSSLPVADIKPEDGCDTTFSGGTLRAALRACGAALAAVDDDDDDDGGDDDDRRHSRT